MIGLFGSTGYVGQSIAHVLTQRGLDFLPIRHRQIQGITSESLASILRDHGIDFLINSAGYTGKPNVDACELDKANCLDGNATLVGRIREACELAGIPFGHVSSGCIFTGSHADGTGFTEAEPPNFSFRQNNCSFYSGTKALGEEMLADCESCYVWRLRIPFDHRDSPRNYLSKVQRYDRLLEATNSLSHLGEFASACVDSWVQRIPFGIYNVVNGGSITTRRVTELIAESLPRDRSYEFFDDEVEFMAKAATTPRSNCVLDNSKILAAGIAMRPVEDAIRDALEHWQPETSMNENRQLT
ncbi:sugar nucleotide-binding protein [Allorhodopirellula heiligendammensis]|uniref:dTDP-4-dehydrorhamnose reductase n=1 Tax=Allorhodopirellula heiligendammensis TaxID=2714739 RepID=A0A5C6C1P2_9BACT|nr:sugar nucleotide-binding protein [Allorhodopirellula heiligendammensis]TWU18062.1 RmlD substrate binding domain protein [Allorhodopirellula heiligendammensis]